MKTTEWHECVDELLQKAKGNFLYIHYIFYNDREKGGKKESAPLTRADVRSMPDGDIDS